MRRQLEVHINVQDMNQILLFKLLLEIQNYSSLKHKIIKQIKLIALDEQSESSTSKLLNYFLEST